MAIEKIFICIRKKLRSILMHLKLTGMYGKIMQFSGVIWKYMLCRVGFLWNIYMLIETHVTLFYCTIKYFPYILYFCEQNQFRNLTHFPEYKILFSLVQFFLFGKRRNIQIMIAQNTKFYVNLYFCSKKHPQDNKLWAIWHRVPSRFYMESSRMQMGHKL